jgi:26S proteasome regulatory subunit N1
VPLALALLNVSHPEMTVMDTLSRLTHDTDTEVAMNAVMGLGFIGAGTNNARYIPVWPHGRRIWASVNPGAECRLAGILRNLSSYYYKEPTILFLVRVAQGLVHMGKGLLTLNPCHSENALLSGRLSQEVASCACFRLSSGVSLIVGHGVKCRIGTGRTADSAILLPGR